MNLDVVDEGLRDPREGPIRDLTRPADATGSPTHEAAAHSASRCSTASLPLPTLPPETVARLNAITDPLKQRLGPSFDYYESPENDRTQ